ncbi:unnamed protein product [Umbelopsis vinacea]
MRLSFVNFQDGTVGLWDVEEARYLATYEAVAIVSIFRPFGTTFITAGARGDFREWQVVGLDDISCDPIHVEKKQSRLLKHIAQRQPNLIRYVNGNLLSKSVNGRMEYWDPGTEKSIRSFCVKTGENFSRFDVSLNESFFRVGSSSGAIYVFNLHTGKQIAELQHRRFTKAVRCCVFTLTENSHQLIDTTTKKIIELYNRVLGTQSNKQKLPYIAGAVAAVVLYKVYSVIALPPKALRGLPYINNFKVIWSTLRGDTPWIQYKKLYAPALARSNNLGMYVRSGRVGWCVYVENPVLVKKVLLKGDVFPRAEHSFGEGDTLLNGMIRHPSILTEPGEKWKKHRKASSPAFHRSMPVNIFGHLVQNLFVEIEKNSNNVEISGLLERFGFDAITSAGFEYNANAIGNKDSEWVKLYTDLKEGAFNPLFFLIPAFDTKYRHLFPSRVQLHQDLKLFLRKIEDIIVEKRAKLAEGRSLLDETEKDLCTLMLEAEADGEGSSLSNSELMNDIVAFILAGHDTTANALSSSFYYLAKDKAVQQKLRAEAIEYLGDEPHDVIPTVEQSKAMPFLNMVIRETLRIAGPAVWTSPRTVSQDTELGDYLLPKGTHVIVDIIALQHDEDLWPEPYRFDPERFAAENKSSKTASSWLPFGGGQHQCAGMNMSLAEQRVLLSMMVRKYEWDLVPGSQHQNGIVMSGMDIIGPKELRLVFKKRY